MAWSQKDRFFSLCFLFLFLGLHFQAGDSDLLSDREALVSLRAALAGRTRQWDLSETTPCNWRGVTCEQDRVVQLRLPGYGLSGQIPAGTLSNLTMLQTLSLRYNALSGSIPTDVASLPAIRNVFLQNNLFSGDIPEFVFGITNLTRLNLAGNKLTGEISPNFSNLTGLVHLSLEDNHFTGSIPDLNLKLVKFNVSNNQLSGSIPTRFKGFPSSAFEGNSLCGEPLKPCNATESGGSKLSGGAIAGIVIGSVLALIILILVVIFLSRRKKSQKTNPRDVEVPPPAAVEMRSQKAEAVGSAVAVAAVAAPAKTETENSGLIFFGKAERVFDLESLLRASAEVLGKGTFGTAYKATLETGVVVAVKRLKDVTVTENEFREKIQLVGGMDHENLVALRAYYYSRDEKLLVHDYMPIGSLSAVLHGNRGSGRSPITWETRSRIALGAARGITYLHSQGPTTSHGNIKASNVLLTASYDSRVSDFGLAHLAGPAATPNRIDGYRAPEVTDSRKVSQKADVYSFGVLLLELLTGKAPTHALLNEEGVDLPRWVQSIVREEWTTEVFDVELIRYQGVEEEMVQLLQLAIDCTAQYPDKRPSMVDLTRQIEDICLSSSQREQRQNQDTANDNSADDITAATHSVD